MMRVISTILDGMLVPGVQVTGASIGVNPDGSVGFTARWSGRFDRFATSDDGIVYVYFRDGEINGSAQPTHGFPAADLVRRFREGTGPHAANRGVDYVVTTGVKIDTTRGGRREYVGITAIDDLLSAPSKRRRRNGYVADLEVGTVVADAALAALVAEVAPVETPDLVACCRECGEVIRYDAGDLAWSLADRYSLVCRAGADEGRRVPTDHSCIDHAEPYESDGPLGHGWACGRCGRFLQAG